MMSETLRRCRVQVRTEDVCITYETLVKSTLDAAIAAQERAGKPCYVRVEVIRDTQH